MNASTLVVAGSETSASIITSAFYFLLTCPDAYQRIRSEVRSSFKSAAEINVASVNKLEYLLACLNETMRMMPPVPSGLPRVVPRGGKVLNEGSLVPQDVSALLVQMGLFDSV